MATRAEFARKLEAVDPPAEPGVEDPPAWILAYDLIEIEEQCRELADRIEQLRTSGKVDDFWEVSEDIVHLLYHLRSPALRHLEERVER